jgi:hypothetical protein
MNLLNGPFEICRYGLLLAVASLFFAFGVKLSLAGAEKPAQAVIKK